MRMRRNVLGTFIYRSSTQYAPYPTDAWFSDFSNGLQDAAPKYFDNYLAWAVRSANAGGTRRIKNAGAEDQGRTETGRLGVKVCSRGQYLPSQVRHHSERAGRGLGLPLRLNPGQHGLAALCHGGRAVAWTCVAATRRKPSAGAVP